MPKLQTIVMLKSLIIATVLLPTLAVAQRSQQLPQPRQPGQWCPVGWMASGSYCLPGSDKAPAAILGVRPVGARAAAIASAEVRTAPLRPGSAWPGRIFCGCDAPLSISAAPALPRAVRARNRGTI